MGTKCAAEIVDFLGANDDVTWRDPKLAEYATDVIYLRLSGGKIAGSVRLR